MSARAFAIGQKVIGLAIVIAVASSLLGLPAVARARASAGRSAAAGPRIQPQTRARVNPRDVTVLTYWDNATNEFDKKCVDSVYRDAFNKINPSIQLVTVHGQTNDKTLTALSGGRGPDIYYFWDSQAPLGDWAQTGVLTQLDSYIKTDHIDVSKLLPAAAQEMDSYNGHYYGMPSAADSMTLFWNKHIFKQAGLNPEVGPRTLEQWQQWALKLTTRDAAGHITRIGSIPASSNWAYYATVEDFPGGMPSLYSPARRAVHADSPAAVKAAQWVQAFFKQLGPAAVDRFSAGLGNSLSANNPFLTGKIAMDFDGDWIHAYVKRYAANRIQYPRDYGVEEIPPPAAYPEASRQAFLEVYPVGIPITSHHKKEAWQFLKWMLSTDVQVRWAYCFYNMPGTNPAYHDPRLLHAVGFGDNVKMLQNRHLDGLPIFAASGELDDRLGAALDLIIHGKQTPQQALHHVTVVVQKNLNDKLHL